MVLMRCTHCQCTSMKIDIRFVCQSCEHLTETETINTTQEGNATSHVGKIWLCDYTDEETDNCGCYLIKCAECGYFVERIGED